MVGYIWAAGKRSFDEIALMSPEERAFAYFWLKEVENEQMSQLGRLLGTSFRAGEIRSWAAKGGSPPDYKNSDKVLVPLSFGIRPELRESLIKLVGSDGMMLPSDYKRQKNEMVVDLSKVSPQEFKDFLTKKILPELRQPEPESRD